MTAGGPDDTNGGEPAVRHLFVYGTLRPGDERWPFLAPFVTDGGHPDATAGAVHDTGRNYPAAIFGGTGRILGRTFELIAERRDEALALLDEVESAVDGLYRRVVVTTESGATAWAYAYGAGLTLTPIDSGDWFEHLARQGRPLAG